MSHRLHKQIMDIGGSKLQAVQARVDAIARKIDEATGQITKANVGVKTAERWGMDNLLTVHIPCLILL